MSAKPKPSDAAEFREITVNGQTVRVPLLHLRHPPEKGDAVRIVRACRGYRG